MSERAVFFFDIDNCLYSKSMATKWMQIVRKTNGPPETKIQEMMSDLIDKYFEEHLELSQKDANELHLRYYKDYGLAIEGLVRHHKVDPLEYNRVVDDALPLEGVITRDENLRSLLLDLDRSKVKPWLFTNAYVNHGKRVVKLLGVDDLFEGITYCDYGAEKFICKPSIEMFAKAQQDAGASSANQCYFVDDSALNCFAAKGLGWHAVHLVEAGSVPPSTTAGKHTIADLQELRQVFPQFFKSTSA